jgi:hypothetical protein
MARQRPAAAPAKRPSCTTSSRTDARAWFPGTAPSSAHKSEAAGRRSWPSAPGVPRPQSPLSALPAVNPLAFGTLGEKRPAVHAVKTHSAMLPVTRTRSGEKSLEGAGSERVATKKRPGSGGALWPEADIDLGADEVDWSRTRSSARSGSRSTARSLCLSALGLTRTSIATSGMSLTTS